MELSPASLVFLQITSEMSGREGGEGRGLRGCRQARKDT
jgi:hypothetical protein